MVAALIMGAAIRPRPAAVKTLDVIPGRIEDANPESRDSPMCNCASEVRCFASPRNDGWRYGYLAEAAMISCSMATWRAKAPRPAAVVVTVVCGFLPTKAFSTAT